MEVRQYMKNALVYAVNCSSRYVKMLINSINSFCATNGDILNAVDIFIICD